MLGVSVNGMALGGLTKQAAAVKLNAAITIYENTGLSFTDGKKTRSVEAVQIPAETPMRRTKYLTSTAIPASRPLTPWKNRQPARMF